MITNKNKTIKAVIYCRVSSKEQVEEGNSLVTQEKFCKEYALKNGYEVTRIFIEQGESAKNQNRTQLKLLIDYCTNRKNDISFVIVYKLDRMARNSDDYSQIRILLKQKGIEIKSTSEYFENTPAGKFMENIIANVAQFDNDVRTERCIGGMREAMREGRYVWSAPLGYKNMRIGGKSTIVQNTTAVVVKKTFEEISKNLQPIEHIRIKMVKEGLVGKTDKPITKGYFYDLLKNPLYCGWIIKFGERHKGLYEPIISQELFDRVQFVLKHRTNKITQYQIDNPDFPLRRFIKHPSGQNLTGSWSQGRTKKYAYYRFKELKMEFKRESLEEDFKALYDQFTLNDEQVQKLRQYLKKHLLIGDKNKIKERGELEYGINELKEKRSKLIQKNLDGVIADGILREQLDIIETEIWNKNQLLLVHPNKHSNILILFDVVAEYLKKPSIAWEKASNPLKLRLQWFNFPKGLVFDGKKIRTTEICFIYKAKSAFGASLSANVDSSLGNPNNPEITTINKTLGKNKKKEPFLYWQQVGDEIERLAEIVQESKDPPV